MPLPAESMLTPVWIVKSRAWEYREATARKCIEMAYSKSGPEAIMYLRRAVDLCGEANFVVPGLSRSCIQYIQAHPSSSHDAVCTRLFAAGLLAAGLKDEAAGVYYSLLHGLADRAHQAELLKQCLSCWSSEPSGCPNAVTFQKLAAFIQSQTSFSWGSTIEVVQAAGFEEGFVLRLCEELIVRQPSSSNQADQTSVWSMQKEVLMKYVKISLENLTSRQKTTDEALSQLVGLHQAQQREIETQQAHQRQTSQSQAAQDGKQHHDANSAPKKPWHRRWPVVSAAWAVASTVGNRHPVCRAAHNLLLVYFLRRHCC